MCSYLAAYVKERECSCIWPYLASGSVILSLEMTNEFRGGNSYGMSETITAFLVCIPTTSSFLVGATQPTGYGHQGIWTNAEEQLGQNM